MAQHNELGKLGETFAASYLILHGFEILATDYQHRHSDIDIIAQKLGLVIFVEVKTRHSGAFEDPEEAVDSEKIRSLLSAANAFLNYYKIDLPYRFDIIALTGARPPFLVTHIRDAFNEFTLQPSALYTSAPIARQTMQSTPDPSADDPSAPNES